LRKLKAGKRLQNKETSSLPLKSEWRITDSNR
jgi:hypothetical protein